MSACPDTDLKGPVHADGTAVVRELMLSMELSILQAAEFHGERCHALSSIPNHDFHLEGWDILF